MDIKIWIVLMFLSMQLLMINCKYLEVKELWDNTRRICGNTTVQNLTQSLKAELQNQQYTTKKNSHRKDRIVITYEDFRCCLKKTIVKDLRTKIMEVKCMEMLLGCLVQAQKNPCTLENGDFVALALSQTGVIYCIFGAAYGMIIFVLLTYYFNIQPDDHRVSRRRFGY